MEMKLDFSKSLVYVVRILFIYLYIYIIYILYIYIYTHGVTHVMLIVIFLHPVSLYRLCIQTDIQHRVHHARHACPPAGPHCNQKWVLRVSKFAAGSRPQVRCSTKQTIDTGTSRCQAQENYNAETCHSLISS